MPGNRVRVLLIYLLISVHIIIGNGNTKIKFIMDSDLDGFNCPADHRFHTEGNKSMSQCLAICADSTTCFAVFRHQESCVGCKDKYLLNDNAPLLNGTTFLRRQSYLLVTDKKTWFDAKNHCAELGGHLVDIKSSQENTFLVTFMASEAYIWSGATDLAKEDTFIWEDGSILADLFTNWIPTEPSNSGGNEHCSVLDKSGVWNDINCQHEMSSVCELD